MQTPNLEGVMVATAEDLWEDAVLMLEGLKHSSVYKEEKQFGR